MVGVLAYDETAMQGVILQLVAHGLSVAAMFIVIGGLEHRRSSRGIGDFGGLASTSPLYAVLIVCSMIAAVAMPGTAAFAGEFLIFLGVAKGAGGSLFIAAVIGLSVVLTAACCCGLRVRWYLAPQANPLARRNLGRYGQFRCCWWPP